MDCSLPGSSIHGILQARILEWVAIFFSRESFQSRNRTWVSCTAGRFFTDWAIVPIKSTMTTEVGKKRKIKKKENKKSKRFYRTSQNIRIINVFLESLLSESFPSLGVSPPHLPRMPSNAVLVSGPAVGAAQFLIWSYFRVFLPPVSTAIRTSAFSFVGALSDLLYIP